MEVMPVTRVVMLAWLVMPVVMPRMMPSMMPVVMPLVVPLYAVGDARGVVREAMTMDTKQLPCEKRQRLGQHLLFASNLRRQRLGERAHQKAYQIF